MRSGAGVEKRRPDRQGSWRSDRPAGAGGNSGDIPPRPTPLIRNGSTVFRAAMAGEREMIKSTEIGPAAENRNFRRLAGVSPGDDDRRLHGERNGGAREFLQYFDYIGRRCPPKEFRTLPESWTNFAIAPSAEVTCRYGSARPRK
jgi:hypothetical protein